VNHSCEPNAGLKFSHSFIRLIAIVPIGKGEQITYDYSTSMLNFPWKMACFCGSKQCRRIIENFIDLPVKVQLKYIRLGVVPGYVLGNSLQEQQPGQEILMRT
jgi:hypothetical protein